MINKWLPVIVVLIYTPGVFMIFKAYGFTTETGWVALLWCYTLALSVMLVDAKQTAKEIGDYYRDLLKMARGEW